MSIDYFLSSTYKTHAEARSMCEAQQLHLASIPDQYNNDRVQALLRAHSTDTAHFGYNDEEVEGVWEWENGQTSAFTAWDDNQPDNYLDDEDCALFRTATGRWLDTPCRARRPYVCSAEEGPRNMVIVEGATDWRSAEEHCRVQGMDLVWINNVVDNQHLADLMTNTTVNRVWLGLHDRWSESEFEWTSEEGGSTADYTRWRRNEPNNANGEDCVSMLPGGFWNDWSCHTKLPFACRAPTRCTRMTGFQWNGIGSTVLWGGNIRNGLRGDFSAECCHECRKRSTCVAWNYWKSGWCNVYSSVTGHLKPGATAISGMPLPM